MGSKGHIPPPLIRRALPAPGMMHPDPFVPSIHPPSGAYSPFDMLPPPEILEQKILVQHAETQRLGAENQRLAATHVALRQDLAVTQQELQRLQAQVGTMKHEKEQNMRGLMDKIVKMEKELQAAETIKMELQQAQMDAQNLIAARQELVTKVQHLTQDHQRIYSDVQQVPTLISELESLRQQYQDCRATYDYEKKLYKDHYESLQLMEKNYLSMTSELEKLRAELANVVNVEQRTGAPYGDQHVVAPYGSTTGYKVHEPAGHQPVGQIVYGDGYRVSQGRGVLPTAASPYDGGPIGSSSLPQGAYDAPRGPGYEAPPYRVGPVGYAPSLGGHDASRGPGYEAHTFLGHDASSGNAGEHKGLVATPGNTIPYGSATPPNISVGGYNGQLKGGNSGGSYNSQLRGGNLVWR